MKIRNKFTVSDYNTESVKKQISSSNFLKLQKNITFLENYSNLFRKRYSYSGDAESYFKRSLRNSSDDFELINKLKSPKFVRIVKSSEVLKNKDLQENSNSSKSQTRVRFSLDEKSQGSKGQFGILNNNLNPFEEIELSEMAEDEPQALLENEEGEEAEFLQEDEGEIDDLKEDDENIEENADENDEEIDEENLLAEENDEIIQEGIPEDRAPEPEKVNVDLNDAEVLIELENAENQAKETRDIIYNLKNYIAILLKKDKLTEEEAKELEEKNMELKKQMALFEEKTRRIQDLIQQTNLLEGIIPPKPLKKYKEDCLPKVIVCGKAGSFNVPRLVLTENTEIKSRCTKSQPVSPRIKKESDNTGKRSKCQSANFSLGRMKKPPCSCPKEDFYSTANPFEQQVNAMQNQILMLCQENNRLQQNLQQTQQNFQAPSCPNKSSPSSPTLCGKGRGICPADMEARLQEYTATTQQLEQQLCALECDVQEMHKELVAVQKERMHLEHHRKILAASPPCSPPPCPPPPCSPHVCPPPVACGVPDSRLRELREQYNRLQDDFKGKLVEVGGLRAENEKLKSLASKRGEEMKNCEEKVKTLEREIKSIKNSTDDKGFTKEQFIELVQQLNVAKQRFRESQDELDELRALILDQQNQLADYKNKYLEAQQTVEEQRRQIDMMDLESGRIAEQVNLEIQRVKNQFQEKLQELEPLPDILKTTQLKLQDAQQMHLLAERNNEALAKELETYKDKVKQMVEELDKYQTDQLMGDGQKDNLQGQLNELQQKIEELEAEIKRLTDECQKQQDIASENERIAETRLHQITQLQAQMESVREESGRQVARIKDRCETVRRALQNDINDLERQLAQSRAAAKAAQKDRDEIRQKMQAQISNLYENFEDAQMRIRNLQAHVNFLNTSGGNVFGYPEPNPASEQVKENPCNCGN